MQAADDNVIRLFGDPAPRPGYSKSAIALAAALLAMRAAGVVLAGIGAARLLGV